MDAKEIQSASIIPSDGTIVINGEAYSGCDIERGEHKDYGVVHAIQWWGDHGHTEHGRGPAIPFTDVERVMAFVPTWLARRAEVLREQATHYGTQLTSALENLNGQKLVIEQLDEFLSKHGSTLRVPERERLERTKAASEKSVTQANVLVTDLTERHAAAAARATAAEKDAAG